MAITVHLPRRMPKGITKERAEELTRWVYKVWDMHWKEFAPTSNSRSQFQAYVLRDYKDLTDKQLKEIELAVRAYTKHLRDMASKNQKLIGIKTLSVWYNQQCYNDPFIDDHKKPEVRKRICEHEGCNNVTHGPMYSLCTDHIPNSSIDVLRAGYKGMVNAGEFKKKKGMAAAQLKDIIYGSSRRVLKDMDEDPKSGQQQP